MVDLRQSRAEQGIRYEYEHGLISFVDYAAQRRRLGLVPGVGRMPAPSDPATSDRSDPAAPPSERLGRAG